MSTQTQMSAVIKLSIPFFLHAGACVDGKRTATVLDSHGRVYADGRGATQEVANKCALKAARARAKAHRAQVGA